MKKIQPYLTRVLAQEMETGYLAEAVNIPNDELAESIEKICQIKDIQYSGERFDLSTVMVLGIDNCCSFFKTVCQEYGNYKGIKTKGKDKLTLNIVGRDHISDISYYNIPKKIDEMVEANFNILKKRDKGNNPDYDLYEKVVINTFASFYYGIRDVLEGKSYYDQYNTSRELPDYYIYSQDDLDIIANQKGVPRDLLKEDLLEQLDSGIDVIAKVIYKNDFGKSVKVKKK